MGKILISFILQIAVLLPIHVFALDAASDASDWPRWRGPDGNGITSESGWDPNAISDGLQVAWKAALGVGFSSVAISDGLVYTMGNTSGTDTVYCLDFGTGNVVWSYSYSSAAGSYPGPYATPAVEAGVVYTLSKHGHLFAFDAKTGDVRWSKNLMSDYRIRAPGWGISGSPIVVDDILLLNAGRSGLALDKRNGKKIWDSGSGPGGHASPVVYTFEGKKYAAIFGSNAIYGVEIDRGKVAWSYPWTNSADVNAADPVIYNGKVFIASAYNKGSAVIDFSGKQPEKIWQGRVFNTHFSSFIAINGYIYGNDGDARQPNSGVFRCIELQTGKEMWSASLGFGSLIAAGDKLIMLNSQGGIFIARVDSGSYIELSRAALPRNQYWTSPVLSHGRLFVRNMRGDLYCINVQ